MIKLLHSPKTWNRLLQSPPIITTKSTYGLQQKYNFSWCRGIKQCTSNDFVIVLYSCVACINCHLCWPNCYTLEYYVSCSVFFFFFCKQKHQSPVISFFVTLHAVYFVMMICYSVGPLLLNTCYFTTKATTLIGNFFPKQVLSIKSFAFWFSFVVVGRRRKKWKNAIFFKA